jgi:hypothetical protein
MFRAVISPILRSTRLCLQLVVQCTDGVASWQYRQRIIQQSSAPEDGRKCRPKHVELIGIITKLFLLHLVCCLYKYIKNRIIDWMMHPTEMGNLLFFCWEYLTLLVCFGKKKR